MLRLIVLGIISDQGEYRFVKKKKKGNILLLFIYSVVTTDWQHKCKLQLSLLLSFFLPYSLHKSFELGANTDVTKNNVCYGKLCFIIAFPNHIFIVHYCKLNYLISKSKSPWTWATGMAELCLLGIEASCHFVGEMVILTPIPQFKLQLEFPKTFVLKHFGMHVNRNKHKRGRSLLWWQGKDYCHKSSFFYLKAIFCTDWRRLPREMKPKKTNKKVMLYVLSKYYMVVERQKQ